MVGRSISGTQKDVDTKSDSDRCVAMAADGLQLSTFRVSKDGSGARRERHTISMRPPITLVKTFQIQETSDAGYVLLTPPSASHCRKPGTGVYRYLRPLLPVRPIDGNSSDPRGLAGNGD